VASPLPSETLEPAFLPFFGMKRAPFLGLSAPTEAFHSEQSALLNSHLEAATRRPDSLLVIIGADRIGKTTLLNQFVAGLDDEVCCAAFDETCAEAIQFHRSFLEQIGLGEVVGTLHELQHITSEYLVHRAWHGGHAVIFMDNAHLARPAILEQLRWIADTKVAAVRACSMVLAGNLSFQRILESPAMRSLSFRYRTSYHIRAFCEAETDDYIKHRLSLAGAADAAIFPDEARALVHRFTGGNPSMINLLCNEVLAQSCAQGAKVISEQRVRSAAQALGMPPHAVPIRDKGRRRNDPERLLSLPDAGTGERILTRQPAATPPAGGASGGPPAPDVGIRELLVRITELSSQLDRKAEEEKHRAAMDARKHDKNVGELRAQLAAQVEQVANLSRTLDDKAREIGALNAALLDSERLRQDAGKARQSLADALDALREKLDAGNREIELLTARQDQNGRQVSDLTQALTERTAALADRDATIRKLTADLARPEPARPQVESEARNSIGVRRKQRRITQRTRAMRDDAQPEKSPSRESPGAESGRPAAPLRSESDSRITGTSETKTLIPHQMTGIPAEERPAAAPQGQARSIELFLDGKPWRVVDLAGRPPRMMIGRADDCDLRLDSKYVSRHHAILVNHEGHVAIEDLRSSNGIFVNARKVSRSDLLPDDTVTIGNFWLRIKQG